MNYSRISETEANIFDHSSFYKLVPFQAEFNKGKEVLRAFSCRRADGHKEYYYGETYKKERIVLHFTAGNLLGDLGALMKADWHVSTAFLIPRNGMILQLFNSEFWSYHLGPGAIGGNKVQGKETIGIELSNYGILKKMGNDLHTIYSGNGNKDVYCTLDDVLEYSFLTTPYRKGQYYVTFSNEQYDSLIVLLRYLTDRYTISRDFLPEDKRYEAPHDVVRFDGIVSHVNYRTTGKWDIGPAFDWDRVISGVDENVYAPDPNNVAAFYSRTAKEFESSELEFTAENQADEYFGKNNKSSDNDELIYGEDGPGQ